RTISSYELTVVRVFTLPFLNSHDTPSTSICTLSLHDALPISIAPGPIMTDALAGVMTDEIRQIMENNTPLGCLGEVEDIAAAALYLASPASRWVTGKVIEVDGGAETSVFPT